MNRHQQHELAQLKTAAHPHPFSVLGRHPIGNNQSLIRFFNPHAQKVRLVDLNQQMLQRKDYSGFYEIIIPTDVCPDHYQLEWDDNYGNTYHQIDPYTFPPQLSEFDLYLFNKGDHWHAYRILGAKPTTIDDIKGFHFAVWAPHAERVSVIGDFNSWDGRCHPMELRGTTGIWELFIPQISQRSLYKFEIRNKFDGSIHVRIDPYAKQFEMRPKTACLTIDDTHYQWHDQEWLKRRSQWNWQHQPMSIYEVHLGSWQRDEQGGFLDYRTLADRLAHYVIEMGFTHIELLPITEHPLDASWGYQTTGYYAPTSRFGSPDDFRYFIETMHQLNIGVILDWVPGHFPRDEFALANFDGTPLYEYADPRLGEHKDWGTLIFNYNCSEVRNFLISSAMYWIEEFHIDGLRVDAVASMLYLDYSRDDGEWVPNQFGGRENLEAIEFLQQLNKIILGRHPGTLLIAEESTSWPQVTKPPEVGGLGFSIKWNMGWMHDILEYFKLDPIYRQYHQDMLTFGLLYAFSENFVLPFSHDEVVHGKRSLLYRMPGDEWQRFSNLRLLYIFMYTYPGKKLLFMGTEFGQGEEWKFDAQLDWYVLQFSFHKKLHTFCKDLNRLYRSQPALHYYDYDNQGFEWIDCHDAGQSIISYIRRSDDQYLIIVCNFTPVPRTGYRIGVPEAGIYREIFNSDSQFYSGSNVQNKETVESETISWNQRPYSISLTLPPLAGIILERIKN